MIAFLLSFITLFTWIWPWSPSSDPCPHPLVNIDWSIVPESTTSLLEHLPDKWVGEVAALNYTYIPATVKDYFEGQITEIESTLIWIDWNDLPCHVVEWVKEHPGEAAFLVMDIGLFIAPWVLTEPLLLVLGFSRFGPVARSAAAVAQKAIGKVKARDFFAHLQSAAMKGYGQIVVEHIVRAGTALAGLFKWLWGRNEGGGHSCPAAMVAQAILEDPTKGGVHRELKRFVNNQ
ncbi:uncharacterized protein IL334_005969 [Kwoniella shivajii]|uniref:Uncharacterized protein n=1 Tax=Kwoniella shivajii TaxID=564305 RepID=A0ABZ1D5W1_9TREE|nr:hypothetical protein IL334_005969 [Kwoniella shivajii]